MAINVQPDADCVKKLSKTTGVKPEVLCFYLNDEFLRSADPDSKEAQAVVLKVCPKEEPKK